MAKFCMKCGNQLDDDTKFCDACGTKVNTPPIQVSDQSVEPQASHVAKGKNKKGIIILVGLIGVLVVFFAFRTVMTWFDPGTETNEVSRDQVDTHTESNSDTTSKEIIDPVSNEDTASEEERDDVATEETVSTETSEDAETITELSWNNELFGGTFVATDSKQLLRFLPESTSYETIYETSGNAFILSEGINHIYPFVCTTDVTVAGSRVVLVDLYTMEESAIELSANNDSISVSWSPNGELLAIGNDGKVYIYKLQEDSLFMIDEDAGYDFAWTADSSALCYTTHGYETGSVRLKLKVMGGGIEELYSLESESVKLEFEMEDGSFSSDVFYLQVWSTNTQEKLEYRGLGFQYKQDGVYLYDDWMVMYDEYLEWLELSDELIGRIYSPNLNTFPEFTYPGAGALFVEVRGQVTAYYTEDVSQFLYMGDYSEFEVVSW